MTVCCLCNKSFAAPVLLSHEIALGVCCAIIISIVIELRCLKIMLELNGKELLTFVSVFSEQSQTNSHVLLKSVMRLK